MSKTWAVAFAGPGEVTPSAAEALLDDWLPEDDLEVFVVKPKRSNKGLKNVVAWLEGVEQEFDYDEDPVAALLASKADEKYLVLLWGDEGDDVAEDLLTRAQKEDIPVKDLTAGLDDLMLEDDEPEATPEPEPEEKPKRGRARKSDEEQREQVLDDLEAGRKKDEARKAAQTPAEAPDEAQATREVAEAAPVFEAHPQRLLEALDGFIRAVVREEVALATAPAPVGRPRKDGQPAGSADPDLALVKVIYDEEADEYRKRGRGRPRKGEIVKEITVGEAKELGIELED